MVVFKNFFGTSRQSEIMTTALDLAMTAAGLASNQSDIEPQLHQIQEISAQPGTLLSHEDEATLFDIYLKIEHYLTTADPLRTFNKSELRDKASRGLRARLEAYENQAVSSRVAIA
jgi:hypothetical protein